MKRTLAVTLIASVFGWMAPFAFAAPQASATTTFNFSFTLKDAAGTVWDSSYLRTDVGLDIFYHKPVFAGSPVSEMLIDDGLNSVSINGLNQSRTASQGTASGQTGISGTYSTGISTIGISSHAEVGGGLLNARTESIVASSGPFNLGISVSTPPLFLYIDYNYSIAFETTVLDPSHSWDWSATGNLRLALMGGGNRTGGGFEYVYPYAEPSPVFDSSKMELFSIYFSEWVAGAPSGSISGSNSLAPIALTREGFDSGIGWNLGAEAGASATAAGAEAPIPEPATYAMLLAGLGLLGGIARRRNLKAA